MNYIQYSSVIKPKRQTFGFANGSTPSPSTKKLTNADRQNKKEQLAQSLIAEGRLREAELICIDIIRNGHKSDAAYTNLAAIRGSQGKHKEAQELLKQAIILNPSSPKTYYNLGVAFAMQGDHKSAIKAYKNTLELSPNHKKAHYNLGLTMLLSGDFKNGWEEYEWRLLRDEKGAKLHASPQCKKWDGEIYSKKQKLLLVTEQGLGDTLQFMRYAAAFKDQGFDVSICAQPKLHTLIQVSGISEHPLSPYEASQVKEGYWLPLLSAPRYLAINNSDAVLNAPYIKTNAELFSRWKRLLSKENKLIIGINWQGNPETEKMTLQGRSLPLEAFNYITSNHEISLVSLQKGFGSEQLEQCNFKNKFVTCQSQVNDTWDFLETAAIIANCDLIITNDTAVGHLAGGLGKPTWLLLHKVPDWRWGLKGDTTIWYPSMRLFRQSKHGDWNKVMKRVNDSLQSYLKQMQKC